MDNLTLLKNVDIVLPVLKWRRFYPFESTIFATRKKRQILFGGKTSTDVSFDEFEISIEMKINRDWQSVHYTGAHFVDFKAHFLVAKTKI